MKPLVLLILLPVCAGCEGDRPERPGPKEDESSAGAQAGISSEMLRQHVLPGYRLQWRRLSRPGLGYHYYFRSDGRSVVVTIGLFASPEQARRAAELSHGLMPRKPETESGIGDRAWRWRTGSGAAIRFRTGSALVRIAGDLPYDRMRNTAERACDWIASLPIVRPPDLRLAGLPDRLAAGGTAEFRIAGLSDEPSRPTLGAWASRGGAAVSQDGHGRFTGPSEPGAVRIRCFAIRDDNRISVAERTVHVQQ